MRGESVSRDDMGGVRAEKILASRLARGTKEGRWITWGSVGSRRALLRAIGN